MKKHLFALALSALLVIVSALPAMAQSGTIEISGGTLSIAGAAISFTDVTLSGAAANNVAGTTTAWTAKDPTGTGTGWHVTIAATDFTNGAGKTISVSGFELTLLDAAITPVAGNTKPTSSFATAKALGTAQTLVSAAADTGMGTYELEPTFTLDVPAQTYAGTYTSTVTLQIASGPS